MLPRFTKHHRGNASPMHNLVQNELVDILERMGRKVRKEHEVASRVAWDHHWVIDVADLTDAAHPVYYEVQQGTNDSFKTKMAECGNGTGVDIIPLYLDAMAKELGANPRIQDLRKWIEQRVV